MIPFAKPILDKKEKKLINEVLDSGILVHGNKSLKFEKDFSNFIGGKYSTSTSSCTSAMHMFYFANNIRAGHEVILPAQTHVATAHAIELTGAKPIFIDSELKTGNLDVNLIEKKINKKTKAIVVVHYLGIPVEMKEIIKIAKKYNLFVLEDCALSLGAYYRNKHTGLIGDGGAFSFYPVKHITTGEGGMFVSKQQKITKKINLIKAFGINKNHRERIKSLSYDAIKLGFNYRLGEINSAIGIIQLKKIDKFLNIRKKNFLIYENYFKNHKKLNFLQSQSKNCKSSFYCFNLIFPKEILQKISRNKIIKILKNNNIGTSIYYPKPVPHMKYYKEKYLFKKNEFKNAEYLSNNSISLPVGPHLNKKDILYIIKVIEEILLKYEKN